MFATRKLKLASSKPASIKGANAATASSNVSVAIPTHAVGDLIVVFVFRNGDTSAITVPTAGGTVPSWTTIYNSGGANTCSAGVFYHVATANNHTTGTWANGHGIVVVVISGQKASGPIGGTAAAGGVAANQAVAPAVTMTNTDDTSLLLYFFGQRSATAWSATPPAGFIRLADATSAIGRVCANSKIDTTSDGSSTQASTTGSTGYWGATVEVLTH